MIDTTTQEHLKAREIADEIVELLQRKSKGYGRNLQRHGLRGIVIRLSDKVMRLENLVLKPNTRGDAVAESIRETLLDVTGYALNAIALMDIGDLLPYGEYGTEGPTTIGPLHDTPGQPWNKQPSDSELWRSRRNGHQLYQTDPPCGQTLSPANRAPSV